MNKKEAGKRKSKVELEGRETDGEKLKDKELERKKP